MDRRYQVFISSTFSDLKEERSEIIQALLELDCIPAGMEVFPAANDGAWELIKGVIDDSDYYCLVIAGRYGTVDADGVGFTEKEYDYAISQKKPVMAFVHADPNSLPASKTEKTEAGRERLQKFVAKVEAAHHRKAWRTAAELGGLVSRGLIYMKKAYPAEGWVRGRFAATEEQQVEIADLRARVAELTAAATVSAATSIPTDGLAKGNDEFKLLTMYRPGSSGEYKEGYAIVSWNTILKYVGPALVGECSDEEFMEKLKLCALHALQKQEGGSKAVPASTAIVIPHVAYDRVRVQLQALGQMAPGIKRRAVSDKNTYWRLTEVGAAQLINIQAVRKPKPALAPAPAPASASAPAKAAHASPAGSGKKA